MAFILYNIVKDSTGEIVSQIGADLDLDSTAVTANTPAGHTAYEGLMTDTTYEWYYVGATKTARPLFSSVATWNTTTITANGTSTATLGPGLPNPTGVVIDIPRSSGLDIPAPQTVTSGSFSLTTTVPGVYRVQVKAFPYQGTVYEVTAS